jgi:hypothetical protein
MDVPESTAMRIGSLTLTVPLTLTKVSIKVFVEISLKLEALLGFTLRPAEAE